MQEIFLTMPAIGESVLEASIIKWLKNEGEKIQMHEGIVAIATDKVDTEVPSSHEGILKKQLVTVGETVHVGDKLAILYIQSNSQTVSTSQHNQSILPPSSNIPKTDYINNNLEFTAHSHHTSNSHHLSLDIDNMPKRVDKLINKNRT
jgi:2-oxoglutarate dehydrogenase E2 component (dihydrolipoamide succinyltransferase)